MVFEHTVNGLTAFVFESSKAEGGFAVGMRNANGNVLPYELHGMRREQAEQRAIRWAERGGPMR